MRLSQLYHWSPAARHHSIARDGLRPMSLAVVCSAPYPYVCLGTDPATAWALSGAIVRDVNGFESPDGWDLWQITLADDDQVHVRAEYGPVIQEIQVGNPIPPDRVFYLARRSSPTPA